MAETRTDISEETRNALRLDNFTKPTLDNVPGLERPMAAGPRDMLIGTDELGNRIYRTMLGTTYTVRRATPEESQTTRANVEEWIDEGAPLPSMEQVVDTAQAIPGAVLDSAERTLEGTATLGEAMSWAPGMQAASLSAEVPEGALRIFGGVRSQTAPLDRLPVKDEVRGSTIFGDDDFTIDGPKNQWAQTGWYLGPDGRARYEIPVTHDDFDLSAGATYSSSVDTGDLLSQHRPPNRNADSQWLLDNFVGDGTEKSFVRSAFFTYPLEKVVKNNELLEAYPDLRTLPVVETPYLPHGSGMYSPDTDIIYIGAGMDDNLKRETLAHEIQHAVQTRESFESGSSPEEAQGFSNYGDELVKVGERIQRLEDGIRKGKVDDDFITQANLRDLKEMQKNLSVALYERVYGEEEARAVERRMYFTPEQRWAEFPEDSGRRTRSYPDGGPKLFARGEPTQRFAEGGLVDQQTQFAFMNEGGMVDDGATVEPSTGNEVPPGSLKEEVKDDIDAKLSSGEYVVPADVVQYFGVAHFEKLRQKAKEGLAEMEANGRIGGDSEEDELPFSDEELEAEDMEEDGAQGFAEGGLAWNSPQMTGLTNTGTETVTYVGPDGTKMPILFMNGQPIQQIPQGYQPEGQAKQQQAAFKSVRPTSNSDASGGLNTMAPKPMTEWGVEDFERYSNSQGVMDVVSKLPALLGPGGMIMGGLMNKAYQMQGTKALEEIDNRLAMTDLDEQSRTRLEAVKANLGQNNQEGTGGGMFGGEGLFGGLTGEGGLLNSLFGGGIRTTSEAPEQSSFGGVGSAPQQPRQSMSGAPAGSPRPQPRPESSGMTNPAVTRTSSGNTVSRSASGAKTTSSPGGSREVKSTGESNPGGFSGDSWSTGKAFAEGGLVKRRNKK